MSVYPRSAYPVPFDPTVESEYIIFQHAGSICVKNGRTGQIEFSGSDARSTIQYALNAPAAKKVVCIGDYLIDNSTAPLSISSDTIFELRGRLTALDRAKTLVVVNGDNVVLRGGIYDGNRGTGVAGDMPIRVIHVNDRKNVIIEELEVINGYGRGIEVDDGRYVRICNVNVGNCWRNIMIYSTSYSLPRGHVLTNIYSERAQGGSGVDLGTVGYVTISNLISYEDSPVALAIDSCIQIYVKHVISIFRGIALIYAGYNRCCGITIDGAFAGGAAGALAAEIRSSFDITDVTLRDITTQDISGDALVFRRTSGTGVIDNVRIYDIITRGTGGASICTDESVQHIEVAGGSVDKGMVINAVKRAVRGVKGFVTESSGVATFSGDGTTKVFSIASHGLSVLPADRTRIRGYVTPQSPSAEVASPVTLYPADLDGDGKYEGLKIVFTTPPPAGTNNVVVKWYVEVDV